jgi:hypothetical protein
MAVIHECVPHWMYYLIQMEYTKNMYYRTKIFLQPSSVVMCTEVNGWGRLTAVPLGNTKHGLCADYTVHINPHDLLHTVMTIMHCS